MESERGEDFGDGGTDCHGQCSHWPRNDTSQEVRCAAGHMGPALQGSLQYCGRTGASAPTQSKEMRTSTDGRGRTPPLRKRYKECDAVRNPPVTASPCQPPLGKGAMGTGVRIATGALRPRNDTFYKGCGVRRGTWAPPCKGLCNIAGGQGRPPLRKRNKRCNGRATARVAPTEGYKECLAGGRTGASAPTGGLLMVPCAAGHMGPALHCFL